MVIIAPALPASARARLARLAGLTIVDKPSDAAALLPDGRRVLCFSAGVMLDDRILPALLAGGTHCRLAVWRNPGATGAERVDAEHLWAGLVVVPPPLARDVLQSLGDWDLSSTLLRAAVEHGAQRLVLDDLDTYAPARRRHAPLLWARPSDAAEAQVATKSVIAAAQKGCLDWPARWIHPPVEDLLTRLLLPTPISPNMVTLFTALVGFGALAAFAAGWLWTGLLLVLVVGPLDGTDGKLARARIEYSKWGDLEHVLDKVLEYGWILAIGWWFSRSHGLAAWLIAWGIVIFALAEAIQGEFFRRFAGRQLDDWGGFERNWRLVAGRRNTFFWGLLPFGLTGFWFAGFVFILVYALITWAVGTWRLLRAVAEYGTQVSPAIAANFRATAYDFLPDARRAPREGA